MANMSEEWKQSIIEQSVIKIPPVSPSTQMKQGKVLDDKAKAKKYVDDTGAVPLDAYNKFVRGV